MGQEEVGGARWVGQEGGQVCDDVPLQKLRRRALGWLSAGRQMREGSMVVAAQHVWELLTSAFFVAIFLLLQLVAMASTSSIVYSHLGPTPAQ